MYPRHYSILLYMLILADWFVCHVQHAEPLHSSAMIGNVDPIAGRRKLIEPVTSPITLFCITQDKKWSDDHSAASSIASGGLLWPSRRSTSSAASTRLVPGPKIACTPASRSVW